MTNSRRVCTYQIHVCDKDISPIKVTKPGKERTEVQALSAEMALGVTKTNRARRTCPERPS